TALLLPGAYTVRVTLDDVQGATAQATLAFVVAAPAPAPTTAAGVIPALVQVDQTPTGGPTAPAWPPIVGAGIALAALALFAGLAVTRRRARRRRIAAA